MRELLAPRAPSGCCSLMIGPLVGNGVHHRRPPLRRGQRHRRRPGGARAGPLAARRHSRPRRSAPTTSRPRCSFRSSRSGWSRTKAERRLEADAAVAGSIVAMLPRAKGSAPPAGWLLAWIPGAAARSSSGSSTAGHLYPPELAQPAARPPALRFLLATGVAVAAAAIAEERRHRRHRHAGFTVGTWALDFVAAGRGGFLAERGAALHADGRAARLRAGQLRLSMVLVSIVSSARPGSRSPRSGLRLARVRAAAARRLRSSSSVTAALVAAAVDAPYELGRLARIAATLSRAPTRRRCARIREPLRDRVPLAPEDPRLFDLERGVLTKLARVAPESRGTLRRQSRTGPLRAPGRATARSGTKSADAAR